MDPTNPDPQQAKQQPQQQHGQQPPQPPPPQQQQQPPPPPQPPQQQQQPPPPQQQQPPQQPMQPQQQQPQPPQQQQQQQQQQQPPMPQQQQQQQHPPQQTLPPQPTHPMQYHQIPHNQQHLPPNSMMPVQGQPPPPGYMQYPPHPQAPHPHYAYPHQQQQMQPHPQSPYAVQQHAGGPPPVPHHPQQTAPMYAPHASHAPHGPHPHPATSHQPPPHWVTHGPPPPHQQPHPQQHPMQQHPPQQHPTHYQSSPQPHPHPHPHQQQHAYHPYGHLPPPPQQQPHQPQPHPMQYHQVHNQQHAPHPMAQNPYMQYPQAHPHYYPHHPQQMQPPPPHQSPYAVGQPHAAGPPPMGPHPQAHPQQTGPIYSPHPPPHPHPVNHQPHWVHGPHPQQAPPPPPPPQHAPAPHPQQHPMMQQQHPQQIPHAPQPAYYQPAQPPPHAAVPQQQQLPPPASPHHPPSRTHTPQHPPTSQTPTRVPPPSSTPASPSNVPKVEKKEITFPKNCVEATKPVISKKRKMTSKDVTDIEVWRLLMCLKSGLLAESSWAIDVLSILLNDDSTLMCFGLQNMPGLLEAVLEHFKCCLNELFGGLVSDTTLKPEIKEQKAVDTLPIKKENGVHNNSNNNNNNLTTNNNNINGVKGDSVVSKVVINKKKVNGVVESPTISIPLGDQIIMFNTAKNYTLKTRDGKVVKMKNGVTPVQDEPSYELMFKPVGYSHWQEGNGEDTSHIQVYFERNNFIESSRRCTCLSTILRNLSFIPGNDVEMSRHAGLLLVLGRLLLLKHNDIVYNEPDSAPNEWHLLSSLREDTLVIISNISSSLDLSPYNDKINLSMLDGLLHWACCSSSYALDPFPAPSMTVSPQRLALESLAKLSIIEGNVDLILATPPWSRIEKLFEVLARLLNINEDQTIREFSLVLLSNLTSADSGIARKVALTGCAIPRLISFLETSLADPETFSTTQDMLRRAAITLKYLSQLVDNHSLFAQHQQRLLNLVMSQKLDQEVVPIIADVIFEISLSD